MSMVHETDYGTPRSRAEKTVTLTIDGNAVTVPEGTSIMRAAMEMGTQIPKLCATDMVEAFGSCRMCLVEIEGRAGTPASCTTPVTANMVVHTQTERLKTIRKGDVFRHVLAGAGGWGDPLERDPDAVLKDVRNELLSLAKAEVDYGVVIDALAWIVNRPATEQRRAEIRARRCWRDVPKVQWKDPVLAPAHSDVNSARPAAATAPASAKAIAAQSSASSPARTARRR